MDYILYDCKCFNEALKYCSLQQSTSQELVKNKIYFYNCYQIVPNPINADTCNVAYLVQINTLTNKTSSETLMVPFQTHGFMAP